MKRSILINCLSLTLGAILSLEHQLFGFSIDRVSIYWLSISAEWSLTQVSGHYDLLYKSKDVTEMAIGTLANPEVRLLSEPVYDRFERAYSHSENIGGYLLDMPGFGHCVPVTTFSSKHYQCPQDMSPTHRALSPPMNIHTKLGQTSLGPATRESLSPASKSASPPSSQKAVVEDKFRKSREQLEYEMRASNLRLEQEKAGFTE